MGELDSLRLAIQESEELIQQYITERSFYCEQWAKTARQYTELKKGNNEYII
jgi:hypothetical protein